MREMRTINGSKSFINNFFSRFEILPNHALWLAHGRPVSEGCGPSINKRIVGTKGVKVPFLSPAPPKQCFYTRNVNGDVPNSILNISSVQNNIELREGDQIDLSGEVCSISIAICTFALMFQQIFWMIVARWIRPQNHACTSRYLTSFASK